MKCLFTKILPLMVCTLLTSLTFSNPGTTFTLPNTPDKSILERIPKEHEGAKEMLKYLFELQEKEMRPNALIHYALASIVAPDDPTDEQEGLLDTVCEKGWTKEADTLLPYLQSWQPAFKEIRKGAALNYAKGIGMLSEYPPPVPNYMVANFCSKAMCAEGKWLESNREYRKALEAYLTLLVMGRDFTTSGNESISCMVGYMMISRVNTGLHQLLASGKLQQQDLAFCRKRLANIEGTTGDLVAGKLLEKEGLKTAIAREIEEIEGTDPEEISIKQGIPKDEIVEMIKSLDHVYDDLDKITAHISKGLKAPWWNHDRDIYHQEKDSIIKDSCFFLQVGHPDMELGPKIRHLNAITGLRQAQMQIALELRKLDKKAYPKKFEALVPKYIADTPQDPFSGKPMRYQRTATGYKIWSLGPDIVDNKATVVYDCEDGENGKGDVVCGN